jgi:integrase/recombinase XerC
MSTEITPYARPDSAPALNDPRELIAEFMAGRAPSTIAAYSKDLGHFARWLRSDSPSAAAAELLALDVGGANRLCLAYRNAMRDAGLAAATINRRVSALKSLVKVARLTGRVTWSIEVGGVKPEKRRDVTGPDRDEFKKLWRATKAAGNSPRARRDRAAVALLYGMALRREEVVSLDLADVDFRASVARVNRKGHREKLARPVPPEVAKALGDWVLVRGPWPGPLFVRTDRPDSLERLTGEAVARLVARLGVAAKLPKKVRPHGLRHSSITAAFSGGEMPQDVKQFSGHVKLETLMLYHDALKNTASRISKKVATDLK